MIPRIRIKWLALCVACLFQLFLYSRSVSKRSNKKNAPSICMIYTDNGRCTITIELPHHSSGGAHVLHRVM